MSDLKFYNQFVKPLEGSGLTNDQIAASITSQSSRYPSVEMTINQLATALTDAGSLDADGIITRLMSSLEEVASSSFLVSNKLKQLKDTSNPGVIDIGNYLQRSMLFGFSQNADLDVQESDVAAILSLCDVPPPVTAQEVSDAIEAEENRKSAIEEEQRQKKEEQIKAEERFALFELYNSVYNEYLSPLLISNSEADVPTEQQIKDALADMISNWPSN